MADEPENLTLKLLRELRGELADMCAEMREGFELLHLGFERLHIELADLKAERPPTDKEPQRVPHWNTRRPK